MRNLLLGIMVLSYILPGYANQDICKSKIPGYKVLKNSIYPFMVDKSQACFFAFYVEPPKNSASLNNNENTLWYDHYVKGHSLWYGYYKKDNPAKIYEFPKPGDIFWTNVCNLEAVSFRDMNGDNIRDVTVIGSCDVDNQIKYRFPFVFVPQGDKYILNEDVYTNLYGFIDLTVADVSAYIKNPDKQYKILRDRYKSLTLDKLLHEKS